MKQDTYKSKERDRKDTLQERHPIFGLSCIVIGKVLVISIIFAALVHLERVQPAVIPQNVVTNSGYPHPPTHGVETPRTSRKNSYPFVPLGGMTRLNDLQTRIGPVSLVDIPKQHENQGPISFTENFDSIPNSFNVRSLQRGTNFPGTTIPRASLPVEWLPTLSPVINPKVHSLPSATNPPSTRLSANLELTSTLVQVNINDAQPTSVELTPSAARRYIDEIPSTKDDCEASVATNVTHPSAAPLEPPASMEKPPSVPPVSPTIETVVLDDDNTGDVFQQIITLGLSVAVLKDSIDTDFVTDHPSEYDALKEKIDMELEEDITATLQVALGHILTYFLSTPELDEISATGQDSEPTSPNSSQLSSRSKLDRRKKPKIRRYTLFWVQGTIDVSSISTIPIEIENRAKAEIHWIEIIFQYIVKCNVTEMHKRELKSGESLEENGFCNTFVNVTQVKEVIWGEAQTILNGTLLEWLHEKDSRIVGVCEVGDELETNLAVVRRDDSSILIPRQTFGAVLFALTTMGTTLLCVVASRRKKRREGEIYEWSPRMCDENGVEEFLQIGNGLISQQTSGSSGRDARLQTHIISLESNSEMFAYEQERTHTIV